MKNLIVLAVATLFATNAVAAEMKWSGSAGWRYSALSNDDSLDSKDNTTNNKDVSTLKTRSHNMRANLGVMGGWENVEYGLGIRTNGTGANINGDYNTVTNGADRAIGLELAWFRYVRDFGSVDTGLTIGRQKTVIATDTEWQTIFDNDTRWDGFGWTFKFGMFGFNAAQYIMGAVSRGTNNGASTYNYTESSDSGAGSATSNRKWQALYAFQPHMTWKFSDEIEAMFAVTYYKYQHEGTTNRTGGGVASANAGTVAAIATNNYKTDNKSGWDFLANVSLPFNLNFVGDLYMTNKNSYSQRTIAGYSGTEYEPSSVAWTLGLTYGKLKKAHDFTVGYAYTKKGINSVLNGNTNEGFLADNKGHTFKLGYALADNFHLGFRWMSIAEIERVNTTVAAAAGGGATYAGVNANQKMKTSYWELTSGVAF